MGKEIFLYSEDKKYKCAVELADSLDKFNCPDHSVMILFEERDNGTYIIAQARDKRLETEKDTIIDDLQMHNADFMRELADAKNKIADLETKLVESETKCYTLESYNNFLLNQCKKLIKENKQLTHQHEDKGE